MFSARFFSGKNIVRSSFIMEEYIDAVMLENPFFLFCPPYNKCLL